MLFKGTDGGTSPHLLGESVHDFDAREIALVNRSVVRLAGERLLVDAPVGMPNEEAPVTALQLQHPPRRCGDKRPHELLVVDPSAAYHCVEKVGVDGVGLREHGVVAALDHAGAARPPEQSL